ncbi:lipid A deacylase LpxR family protein [soil metagenome]
MNYPPIRLATALAALCLASASVRAGDGNKEPLTIPEDGFLTGVEKGFPSLSFYFDNDLFAGSDSQYTNGARLAWLSSNYRRQHLPPNVLSVADALRLYPGEGWRLNYGFSLTQLIYTPEDTGALELIEDDRPYAGWLGLGFSIHAKKQSVVHSLELNLGVVGPYSFAEDAQNGVHSARGIPEARGWDNQLSNEFVANLFYSTKWRYTPDLLHHGKFRADIIPRIGAAAGNLNTSAEAGLTIRIGYNPPNDFASQRLSPTAYNQQFFIEADGTAVSNRDLGIYLFAGIGGRAVARDIFLDGNTFAHSHSVDKENFVGEAEVGLGVRWGRFKVSYSHLVVTEQFKAQEDVQYIGSIAASYAF